MTKPDQTQAEIIDERATQAREMLGDRLGDMWWTYLLRGLLAGAVGIVAMFWPTGSISVLLQLVGLVLLIDGGFDLFSSHRAKTDFGRVGILSIIVGLILLIWPEGTARFAFFILGAWALITGISYIMSARKMPESDPDRGSASTIGFVALAAGIILVLWPGLGIAALSWAIAFIALVVAAVMFWMAAKFKRARDRVQIKSVN